MTNERPLSIPVILGTTRKGRMSEHAARFMVAQIAKREGVVTELIDISRMALRVDDAGDGVKEPEFSAKMIRADALIIVTPEYNHGTSGALKNAIDFLFKEWNNKAAGFVGYGSAGGVRAVEHLRLVMAEVQVATVRNQVALSLFTDFENYTNFKPAAHHEKSVNQMLDQLIAWSGAMKSLRVTAR